MKRRIISPPRTLGQIMTLVALSGFGMAALVPRDGMPPRRWAVPAPRFGPVLPPPIPVPVDRFVITASQMMDERMIIQAPGGIDEAMIVHGRGR